MAKKNETNSVEIRPWKVVDDKERTKIVKYATKLRQGDKPTGWGSQRGEKSSGVVGAIREKFGVSLWPYTIRMLVEPEFKEARHTRAKELRAQKAEASAE